jgi:hypothetical protein
MTGPSGGALLASPSSQRPTAAVGGGTTAASASKPAAAVAGKAVGKEFIFDAVEEGEDEAAPSSSTLAPVARTAPSAAPSGGVAAAPTASGSVAKRIAQPISKRALVVKDAADAATTNDNDKKKGDDEGWWWPGFSLTEHSYKPLLTLTRPHAYRWVVGHSFGIWGLSTFSLSLFGYLPAFTGFSHSLFWHSVTLHRSQADLLLAYVYFQQGDGSGGEG